MSDTFADQNPFAGVEEYDPFIGGTKVINEGFSSSSLPSASKLYMIQTYLLAILDFNKNEAIALDLHNEEAPSYFGLAHKIEEKPVQVSSVRGVVSVQTSETRETELSFLQLEFYQQFFQVDSSEVGWRCLRSMWPFKVDFINFVSTNPDFYGPLWVCLELLLPHGLRSLQP